MSLLIAAAATFVLLHLLVSGTRLRDALAARIGEGPYMGLFSLASIAALVCWGSPTPAPAARPPTRCSGESRRPRAGSRSPSSYWPCCWSCRG